MPEGADRFPVVTAPDTGRPSIDAARARRDHRSLRVTLALRYHEIHALRREALAKYGTLLMHEGGPPPLIGFPHLGFDGPDGDYRGVQIGPLTVTDHPPFLTFVERRLARSKGPLNILEIGPGRGAMAGYLKARFAGHIASYRGLELDLVVAGPYDRIGDLADLRENVDLVIASEVIEHMTADAFFNEIMLPLRRVLAPSASMVTTVPNPLVAGGIFRDFTHVQSYPWYDLYALMRLSFAEVDVYRTHYLCTPTRLALLPLRVLLAKSQELDWCEGLLCVATKPFPAPQDPPASGA